MLRFSAAFIGLCLLFGSCKSSSVYQVVAGDPYSSNPDLVGSNANVISLANPWSQDSLVLAVQQLHLATIRYPGGTVGNYWDWDLGWIDPDVPDSLMIKWVVKNGLRNSQQRYTLTEFKKGLDATGAKPIFMLNMLSKDLQHSLRNLRRAAQLGMPVEYVELGNELYFGLPYERSVYPTPEDYGETCQVWIDSLKAAFPGVKCAVLGNYLSKNERHTNWTQRTLAHCSNADAVIFHKYSPFGLDGQQEQKTYTAGTEGIGDILTATRKGPTDLRERQQWELDLLAQPQAFANMLGTAQHSVLFYQKLGAPEGMPLWSTEFNVRADRSAIRGTWANSLYLLMYYQTFMEVPFELLTVHNLVGQIFPLIFTDTAGFRHVVVDSLHSTPWELTAAGVATSLIAQFANGLEQLTPLRLKDQPLLTDDRGQNISDFAGWVGRINTSKRIILIHYGYASKQLDLSDLASGAKYITYSSPLSHYINGFESIEQQQGQLDTTLELPPHSVTLISIEND